MKCGCGNSEQLVKGCTGQAIDYRKDAEHELNQQKRKGKKGRGGEEMISAEMK